MLRSQRSSPDPGDLGALLEEMLDRGALCTLRGLSKQATDLRGVAPHRKQGTKFLDSNELTEKWQLHFKGVFLP